jgi:hypothetical protein
MGEQSFVEALLNPPRTYKRSLSRTRGGGRNRGKNARNARKASCAEVYRWRRAIKRMAECASDFIDHTLKQRSFASMLHGSLVSGPPEYTRPKSPIPWEHYSLVCDRNGVCHKIDANTMEFTNEQTPRARE